LFLKHYIIKYMKKYKKLISNNKKGFKIWLNHGLNQLLNG
jgi:hypothetical protein